MVVFPYTMLPRRLRRMQGVTLFSGREGVGALLSGFLTGLEKGSIQQRPGDSPRLGTILIDLLAAQLAHQLDTGAALPAESRQHTVLLQIHAFIQRHLPDTGLSPAMIAAAHNISVRQLHRLFQAEETPVAELIRNSRLERCRSDLTDPLLREVPVRTIATRWGFRGPAHFSRLFRAYYGIGPQECRRMALEGHAATRVVLRTSSGRTATRMPGSAHGT
jgi:AraC-like DNA-binding protein